MDYFKFAADAARATWQKDNPVIPTAFCVGDIVTVLNPNRLPKFEDIKGTGRIHKITFHGPDSTIVAPGTPIYWVEGFATGKSERELRSTGQSVGRTNEVPQTEHS